MAVWLAPRPTRPLIRGFLSGDAACGRQVSVWIGEVLRHPRLRLGNDIEDVAQQVQRKLPMSFRDDRFSGEASLRTYVWRVAQHAAIDHLRSLRAKPAPFSLDEIAEPTDPAASRARPPPAPPFRFRSRTDGGSDSRLDKRTNRLSGRR